MSKGCVLDLRLDDEGGTSAHDYSRYGNDGTLTGCKWVENGLEFNGTSDYVDCGNIDYTGFSELTLSLWTKMDILPANHNMLIDNANSNATNGFAISHYKNGKYYFYHGGMSSYTPGAISHAAWHHIAFVIKQGQTIQGFVDGVGYNIADVSGGGYTIDNSAAHTYIGRIHLGGFWHNGTISNVRIYNHALNASEIKQQYDATKHRYL